MTSQAPTPTCDYLAELKTGYHRLGKAEQLGAERFPKALEIGDLKQARMLHEQLQAALDDFRSKQSIEYVELADERPTLREEFEGLMIFAQKNRISPEMIFQKISLGEGFVRRGDFENMNISTLDGLNMLSRVEQLILSCNPNLRSLTGTPPSVITLSVQNCGLTGDLRAIQQAKQLEYIDVSDNRRLSSIEGIPTNALIDLYAYNCGLSGNLIALQSAQNLSRLDVSYNRSLFVIEGLPTTVLTSFKAFACGLIGVLTELQAATRLQELDIWGNPKLDLPTVQETIDNLREHHSLRDVRL